jgi:hypothetical protein
MGTTALGELVSIQMGHSFRAGVQPDSAGAVGVIQMKDLGDDRVVDLPALVRVSMDVRPGLRVHEGDIIFRSRGDRATCAIVAAEPGCTIVAAPLLLLRVADERVLPAYLNWFINQPPAQAHLARRAEGSNVKMITKRVLEELEIEIPPLERQRRIVELAGLSARQRILEDDLDSLRARLQSGIMMTYARGGAAR